MSKLQLFLGDTHQCEYTYDHTADVLERMKNSSSSVILGFISFLKSICFLSSPIVDLNRPVNSTWSAVVSEEREVWGHSTHVIVDVASGEFGVRDGW